MRPVKLLAVVSLVLALPACWGPIDPGKPGVRTRITPQARGAEWAELRTKIDGVSPVPAAAAHGEGHGEAAAAEAPASH